MSRRSLIAITLAILLAATAVGCKRKESTTDLGLKPAGQPGASSPATATATGTASPMTPGSAGATSGSSGFAPGAPGGAPAKGPQSGTEINRNATGMKVRILWWNDTERKSAKGFLVVYNGSEFKPDTTKKRATGVIGPVPFGSASKLEVYPNGRGGGAKPLVFEFTVTRDMVPDSEVDAIHVEVSDAQVRVLGNAVSGFSQTEKR